MILEHSSPALDEFLDFLGQRVRLKGFENYKGGLDTKGDTTGEHSVYTEYHSHEVMFHVSTMLPFTPNNRQQVNIHLFTYNQITFSYHENVILETT